MSSRPPECRISTPKSGLRETRVSFVTSSWRCRREYVHLVYTPTVHTKIILNFSRGRTYTWKMWKICKASKSQYIFFSYLNLHSHFWHKYFMHLCSMYTKLYTISFGSYIHVTDVNRIYFTFLHILICNPIRQPPQRSLGLWRESNETERFLLLGCTSKIYIYIYM